MRLSGLLLLVKELFCKVVGYFQNDALPVEITRHAIPDITHCFSKHLLTAGNTGYFYICR